MRSILAVVILLGFAVQPALAQHTTGEGDPIDKSSPKVTDAVKPSAGGAETVPDPSMSQQKSMVGTSASALNGSKLAAVKGDGVSCKADNECGTGACKPAGEGRVCVSKQD
jgi:hypothetical protein